MVRRKSSVEETGKWTQLKQLSDKFYLLQGHSSLSNWEKVKVKKGITGTKFKTQISILTTLLTAARIVGANDAKSWKTWLAMFGKWAQKSISTENRLKFFEVDLKVLVTDVVAIGTSVCKSHNFMSKWLLQRSRSLISLFGRQKWPSRMQNLSRVWKLVWKSIPEIGSFYVRTMQVLLSIWPCTAAQYGCTAAVLSFSICALSIWEGWLELVGKDPTRSKTVRLYMNVLTTRGLKCTSHDACVLRPISNLTHEYRLLLWTCFLLYGSGLQGSGKSESCYFSPFKAKMSTKWKTFDSWVISKDKNRFKCNCTEFWSRRLINSAHINKGPQVLTLSLTKHWYWSDLQIMNRISSRDFCGICDQVLSFSLFGPYQRNVFCHLAGGDTQNKHYVLSQRNFGVYVFDCSIVPN